MGTFGTPAAFFQRLADSGMQVLEFNPVNPLAARKDWELNQRDHRKLLIVDGRTAFLGGINISSVYSGGSFRPGRARPQTPGGGPAWRDTDLQLRGPVVAELQKLFIADLGERRRASRWRRRTTFRRPRPRASRWCARSAVRPTSPSA